MILNLHKNANHQKENKMQNAKFYLSEQESYPQLS